MNDFMTLNEMMWLAVQASVKAGKAILDIYETDFEVETKSDDSPLTRADMESHRIIQKALELTGLPVLSEEGRGIPYVERSDWHTFWMVDPLDGTKEFVKRNGEFTVNIALIKENYPMGGVIYIPVTDELFLGLNSSNAWKLNNISQLLAHTDKIEDLLNDHDRLPYPPANRKFTVVCSRSHMSGETEAFINELKATHGEMEYASRGSSLKLCMIAEGMADIYPRFAPTMEWDTAAGQAIAEASGAEVVQADNGERVRYNKEDLLNPWFIVRR